MTTSDRTQHDKRMRRLTRIWVLLMAALLAAALVGCATTTASETATPAITTTATDVPQTTVSTAVQGTPAGVSVVTAPTLGVAEIAASRTPEPTLGPGPVVKAVEVVTTAAGVEDTTILGLTADEWINLAISALLVLLTVIFVAPVLRRVLRRIVKTTSTDLDDRLVTAAFPQLWQFVTVVAVDLATVRLNFLSERLRTLLSDVYFLLYAVILGYTLWKLLAVAIDWYDESVASKDEDKVDLAKTETVLTMVRRVGQITIIAVCTSLVLEHFGVRIAAVAASFGLIGLAFSLAAQNTLADAISGFIIMLDQPFRVGDRIEIQDLGTWGDVVSIGTRTTRIRTRDNRLVIVPNSIIGTNQVTNYTYPDPTYRVQIEIGIGYDADISEVRRIIEEAVRKVDGVIADKPVDALFLEFGDSAMVFRVRWWIHSYIDTRRMFDRVNEAMFKALDAAGVNMPFTTYDVNVSLDADDTKQIADTLRADSD